MSNKSAFEAKRGRDGVAIYISGSSYALNEVREYNGLFYKAKQITSTTFVPSEWEEIGRDASGAAGYIQLSDGNQDFTSSSGLTWDESTNRLVVGTGHTIAIGNTGATIIGGAGIELSGTSYIDTVAVPNFAVWNQPASGTTGDDVLVWDATTKKLKIVSQSLIGGNTITASNGLTKSGVDIQLGGTLSQDTSVDTAGFGISFATSGTTIGADTFASGREINVEGNYGQGFGYRTDSRGVSSFVGGSGSDDDLKPIYALGDYTFNFSRNTNAQSSSHGALADSSAILGGINHNIEAGNTGATIIGGNTIKLTGTTYIDTTAVANLAIMSTPTSGSSDQILIRNISTGKVEYRTASDLGSEHNHDSLYWKVGGITTLSGTVFINSGSNTLQITRNESSTYQAQLALDNSSSGARLYSFNNTGGNNSRVVVNPTYAQFYHYTGPAGSGDSIGVFLDGDGIELRDTSLQGAYYGDDYSTSGITNHGPRWIPDKGHNDITYWKVSGITNITNPIISGNTTFDGNLYISGTTTIALPTSGNSTQVLTRNIGDGSVEYTSLSDMVVGNVGNTQIAFGDANGVLSGSSNLTWNGTQLTATQLTSSNTIYAAGGKFNFSTVGNDGTLTLRNASNITTIYFHTNGRSYLSSGDFDITAGDFNVTGNTTLNGDLTVTGNTNISGTTTIALPTSGNSDQVLVRDTGNGEVKYRSASEIGSEGIYTGSTPSTVTVGGLTAGSTLTGRTITSILEEMLVVYLVPTFSAFTNTYANTVEVGTTISGTTTYNWGTTNSENVQPNSVAIYDVTNGAFIETGLPSNGSTGVTATTVNTQLNVSGDTFEWQASGTTTQNSGFTSSNETTTAWLYRFYGPTGSTPTNSAEVRALSKAFQTGPVNVFTLNTGSIETKFAVALPPLLAIDTVIDLDALSADITSEYVLSGSTINVLDAGGTNRPYNYYEMNVGEAYSSSHRHQITTKLA